MEKKKNKQYKTTSKMGRLSSNNTTTPPPPLGPGPRTFSILSALNELSIFDKVSYLERNNGVEELSLPGRVAAEDHQITTSEGATKQRKAHRITVPHETGFFSGAAFTHHHEDHHHHPPPRRPQSSSSRSSDHVGGGLHGVEFNTPKPPDWIQKIFLLIKSGRLDELKMYLTGLDATVIRHLVNAKGGNLLHCAAGGGQLGTLQWLVSILGRLADTALNDRDQSGRTPILKALKKKRLPCFQWLVLETLAGGKALVPVERERSLLHHAACDGNLVAVQWLTQVLAERGVSLDLKDMSTGMTPLCEAASAGKVLVCHELISRGANPLQQTELGWRPMDYAIRHNQIECANYLTMAETAASLGTMLHARLQEFQALQEDHDSLRGHFRELLRVGKWLAKERTDLIKNFSSIGLKSASSSSLLGGENLAGTRFSDMEHKLGQAEQASKHLLLRNKNTTGNISTIATESLIANGDAFNLQHILAAAQPRYDDPRGRGLGDLSHHHHHRARKSSAASSSDDEEDDTTTFRTPVPIFPYFDSNQVEVQKWGQPDQKSSIAPWLLPNNKSRLGENDVLSLSPSPLNQLDLVVETPPQAVRMSSSSSSTYSSTKMSRGNYETGGGGGGAGYDLSSPAFYNNAEKVVSATILEVIEPNLVSIKGPPDLIRESTRGDVTIDSPKKNYTEIRGSSASSLKQHLNKNSNLVGGGGGGEPRVPIISNSAAPSNKCQNHQSSCRDTDVLLATPPPPPHPSSRRSHGQVMCLEEEESSSPRTKGNTVSKVDFDVDVNVDTIITEDKPKPGRLRLNSTTVTTTRLPDTTTTLDVVTLRDHDPIDLSTTTQHNFHHPYDEDISSYTSSAPQDHLVVLLPESISTSNTPVLRRSFSSFSHSSSTVLLPSTTTTTQGSCPLMSLESRSLLHDPTTHPSPSPTPSSEASHTESALAPPPSHASGDAGSHTESAREEEHVAVTETTKSNHELLHLETGQETHLFGENNQLQRGKILPTPPPPRDDQEENNAPQPPGRPPLVSPSSSSSRIYKASIHYVTKNGRRQPQQQRKAWYEIEASDEEGDENSFLRQQPRPSPGPQSTIQQQPNNTTTTSPSQTHLSVSNHGSPSNSNNNEQRHECDTTTTTTASELNCADIV